MPNVVSAIVSDGFRSELAQFYSNEPVTLTLPSYFKIGCGGWQDTIYGHQPLDPDSTLTDITAGTGLYTATDYAFYFQKAFVPGTDLFYIAPRRARIRCFVDTSEANTIPLSSNAPEFFELGVFDANNVMLVYSTFPMEVKTVDKTLEHYIYIDF